MPNRTPERLAVAEFVRSRRARTSPESVGLRTGPRRRTPGLRREEVAHLAGVGVTWYTWFEQGRDIQVSADFLERLSHALQLNGAERTQLFTLVHRRPPPHVPLANAHVSDAVRRMLATLPNPAYVLTTRWDVVAWNAPAAKLFGDFEHRSQNERNMLWLVFADPEARELIVNWVAAAQGLLETFRLDYARAGGDPTFEALVVDLCERSPEFGLWWQTQDVRGLEEGAKTFRHPEYGEIEFEHTVFAVEGAQDLRLVIYTPCRVGDNDHSNENFGA